MNSTPLTPDHPSTIRRFVQLFVVFVTLFLIVRTLAIEPFGVPTGSMSPALLGYHAEVHCPRCQYRLQIGINNPEAQSLLNSHVNCSNCDFLVPLADIRDVPGDRLMVDKTAFLNRDPRRWEVAVFHCPADEYKPYVKRVVGLPGELVTIRDGDVYVNRELARKRWIHWQEVKIPVFDINSFPNLDGRAAGWFDRWLISTEGKNENAAVPRPNGPQPVDDQVLQNSTLVLDGSATPTTLTYRNWHLDRKREYPIGDWHVYNGTPSRRRDRFGRLIADDEHHAVHDFSVSFDMQVIRGQGRLSISIEDGADAIVAELQIDGEKPREPIDAVLKHADGTKQVAAKVALADRETNAIELVMVDRRGMLGMNGKQVADRLDLRPVKTRRPGVNRPIKLTADGVVLAITNLRIWRDIHYTTTEQGEKTGWQMGEDEYFFLGDNTYNSHDSRTWTIDKQPVPGVALKHFIGKPLLIHQPMRLNQVNVNGSPRLFVSIDWERLRWLR